MIKIPSFRIPGGPVRRTEREASRTDTVTERLQHLPPPRPHPFYIPAPQVMEQLIARALDALSRGIFWDRGSIINLLV